MHHIEKDLQGDLNNDRFIHQFVMGPKFIDSLAGWQQVTINKSFKLTAHPELDITQMSNSAKSITIIGYVLDPTRPEATNRDVAKYLLKHFTNLEQLLDTTNPFGGRWAIIANNGENTFIFNDTLGLRQVFFTTSKFSEGVYAVSQPGLLAWIFKLKMNDDAKKFLDSYVIRKYREYRWPGSLTAFEDIKHLLPNHYVDLNTTQTHRFWPTRAIEKLNLNEGVDSAASILEGLMDAAYKRFDLILGMTAGLDSRVVLAASRKNDIHAVTVRQGQMPENHQDLVVSRKLLGRLKIPHKIIKALPYMSANFSKLFKENVFLAHDDYGPDAEALLNEFSRKKVVATGSGAEVARRSFRARTDANKSNYTAKDIAKLLYMEGNEPAIHAYSQWLDEIGELHNVHLLDLLSWENLHGNWLAGTQMELDVAWHDIFTPFNCRKLLADLLSVDEQYRSAPDYVAFNAIIQKLWPELLNDPINPDTKKTKPTLWRRRIKKKIKQNLFRRHSR